MRTNPALMRAVLAMGAVAGMAGAIIPEGERRPSPDEMLLRDLRRQRQREEAAARAAPHIAKAEAKRRRKALKLAALKAEPTP